jgi:FkbM family methyltransferase
MNKIFNVNNVSPDGRVDFTFIGQNIQDTTEVKIIDENTGLTVYRANLPLITGASWFVTTGENNARKLKNGIFSLKYGDEIVEEKIKFEGQNRYLVVDSKQIKLSYIGDDLFPIVCEIFYDKIYERDFVRPSIGDVIVDIGANYGVFSLYSQMFNPKKVYAVEPVKDTFENMKNNLEVYGVVCINKAISDENGYETFAVTEVNGNNFSFKNKDGYHPSNIINEEVVESITINQLIKDYNIEKIDYLKVDCEGGEKHLFEQIDKEYLKNNINKIAIEYHSQDIFNILMDILTQNNFIIEDTSGSTEIGLIYAYNKKFLKN